MREYLPGVQDILRVEDLFDGLHNLKLFFGKLHADVPAFVRPTPCSPEIVPPRESVS